MDKQHSNMARHAIMEMDVLLKLYPEPDNQPIIEPFRDEIVALMDAFAHKGGHSGNSLPFAVSAVSQAIAKLGRFMPIAPITGDDDEWYNVNELYKDPTAQPSITYQNKRCCAIFKESDGTCTYLDAIAWVTPKGSGWSGGARLPDGSIVRSKAIIKSFPFEPKTFRIPIREEEVWPDDWVFHIDDPSVLDEVKEIYDLIIHIEKIL